MRKRFVLCCAIAVVIVDAPRAWGDERISVRLKSSPIDNRVVAPRLEMQDITDEPEIALQKVRPKKAAPSDTIAKARRRESVRKQKTRRVVASQN